MKRSQLFALFAGVAVILLVQSELCSALCGKTNHPCGNSYGNREACCPESPVCTCKDKAGHICTCQPLPGPDASLELGNGLVGDPGAR